MTDQDFKVVLGMSTVGNFEDSIDEDAVILKEACTRSSCGYTVLQHRPPRSVGLPYRTSYVLTVLFEVVRLHSSGVSSLDADATPTVLYVAGLHLRFTT